MQLCLVSPHPMQLFSHGPGLQRQKSDSKGQSLPLPVCTPSEGDEGLNTSFPPKKIFVLLSILHGSWKEQRMWGGAAATLTVTEGGGDVSRLPLCVPREGQSSPFLGKARRAANLTFPQALSLPAPMHQCVGSHCAKSLSPCYGQIPWPWKSWCRPWNRILFHPAGMTGPETNQPPGQDSF